MPSIGVPNEAGDCGESPSVPKKSGGPDNVLEVYYSESFISNLSQFRIFRSKETSHTKKMMMNSVKILHCP